MCRSIMDRSQPAGAEEGALAPQHDSSQLFELFQQLFGERNTTARDMTDATEPSEASRSVRDREEDFTGMYS
jgi:hypothetical protein